MKNRKQKSGTPSLGEVLGRGASQQRGAWGRATKHKQEVPGKQQKPEGWARGWTSSRGRMGAGMWQDQMEEGHSAGCVGVN